MSAPPFMPLYVGDYLADTVHLTATEDGAYLRLLMCMWRAGGTLPSDDVRLARFCKLTPAQWQRVKPAVMEFFTVVDGVISQRRLSKELQKHSAAVFQRREAGSRGGQAKALKDKETGLAAAMPSPCQPEPEPDKKEDAKASCSAAPSLPADFEAFWKAYPRRVGKLAAFNAWKRIKGRPALPVMLAAIAAYELAKPADIDFCHAATWLNGGRWMDEGPGVSIRLVSVAPTVPANVHAAAVAAVGEPWAVTWLAGATVEGDQLHTRTRTAFDRIRDERAFDGVLEGLGLVLAPPQVSPRQAIG